MTKTIQKHEEKYIHIPKKILRLLLGLLPAYIYWTFLWYVTTLLPENITENYIIIPIVFSMVTLFFLPIIITIWFYYEGEN